MRVLDGSCLVSVVLTILLPGNVIARERLPAQPVRKRLLPRIPDSLIAFRRHDHVGDCLPDVVN